MSSNSESHYQNEESPELYQHKFHAGNIADVWKDTVLIAILEQLKKSGSAVKYFETHAGNGQYNLLPTGEWREGIGALIENCANPETSALKSLLKIVQDFGYQSHGNCPFPGSPLVANAMLKPGDTNEAWELNPSTFLELETAFYARAGCSVNGGDGLQAIAKNITSLSNGGNLLVHIDPPWKEKQDWQKIPQLLLDLHKSAPRAILALWYPIKSYTRVSAMLKFLSNQGLDYTSAELITFPLDQKKNRLNGSGMLLVGCPEEALIQISSAAAEIGPACGIKGYWDFHLVGSGKTPSRTS